MPTPTETTPDVVPPHGFDPMQFWLENKSKVLLFAGLLVVALMAYAAYEVSNDHAQAEARRAFAEAKSEDDYRNVARQFSKSVVAGDARLLLAGRQREAKKYDESVATLRGFIADSPKHPLLSSAWLALGETLSAGGKTTEALDTFQQTATKFPDSYAAPLSMVARAKLLKSLGKMDEAKRAYESVISQFPESILSREAMREMQLMKKK